MWLVWFRRARFYSSTQIALLCANLTSSRCWYPSLHNQVPAYSWVTWAQDLAWVELTAPDIVWTWLLLCYQAILPPLHLFLDPCTIISISPLSQVRLGELLDQICRWTQCTGWFDRGDLWKLRTKLSLVPFQKGHAIGTQTLCGHQSMWLGFLKIWIF